MDIQELNSAAIEITKNNTSEQAAIIKDPVHDINRRWDTLNENIATRMVRVYEVDCFDCGYDSGSQPVGRDPRGGRLTIY